MVCSGGGYDEFEQETASLSQPSQISQSTVVSPNTVSNLNKGTVENRYNEHANNEFTRYNEYTCGSLHVKTIVWAMHITN